LLRGLWTFFLSVEIRDECGAGDVFFYGKVRLRGSGLGLGCTSSCGG
jgi:hypothetical protein